MCTEQVVAVAEHTDHNHQEAAMEAKVVAAVAVVTQDLIEAVINKLLTIIHHQDNQAPEAVAADLVTTATTLTEQPVMALRVQ